MPGQPVRKILAEGQVLCREGDPPGPLYVICSGSVRAYRRSLTVPDAIQELARLGPGDIVGEMAPILRQPRSATVQALEQTEVLEVPPDQLDSLTRRHDSLRRVIAAALIDRAGLSASEMESVPLRLDSPDSGGQHAGQSLPVPPHNPAIVYPKALTCPACDVEFSVLVVHPRKDQPSQRASDFHQRYATPFNPYNYEPWVCPNCLYAALEPDFSELSPILRARMPEVISSVLGGWRDQQPDFNVDRTFELREKALLLMLAQYRARSLLPLRIAAVLHRLAWCARERGDTEVERGWLGQALEAYRAAYEASSVVGAKAELRVLYLCGELSARTGDIRSALDWFGEGLRHPNVKEHPNWERMLRDRFHMVRSENSAAAKQYSPEQLDRTP